MPFDENTDTAPLIKASQALVSAIVAELQADRGVHVETAIAAAGFLAGATLLRQCGAPLDALAPGSTVLVDSVNERGPEVLQFMSGVCAAAGMPTDDWAAEVPPQNQPLREPLDLLEALEGPYRAILDGSGLSEDLRPLPAAHAAIQLVFMGKEVLDPRIGRALAALSVVGGAKTVPPRLGSTS